MENTQDADLLRLLSIFHYVVGCMVGLISLFPLIHIAVGIGILAGTFDDAAVGGAPLAFIGWLFVLFPLFLSLGGLRWRSALPSRSAELADEQRTYIVL
ncbi:MAG: hypothetical protein ABL921_34165 [Pirellula sp.]